MVQPLAHRNFKKLMGVFVCNGFAAALPATLVPFYMRDRLGLAESDQWVLAGVFSGRGSLYRVLGKTGGQK
ncbi:MAG: hypothetical protein HC848_05095 [Limnobacter sp.]|nr:hypothetical protein [Limnobacter sp.]